MSIVYNNPPSVRRRIHISLCLAFSTASLSFALTSPLALAQIIDSSSIIPNPEQIKREIEERSARPAAELPLQAPVRPEMAKPAEDIRVDVNRYLIKGLSRPIPAALEASLKDHAGSARNFEDITGAADAVTRYLQSELGYYLGYAYIPVQPLKDGVIEIDVLEGRLDQVILNWDDTLPLLREVVETRLSAFKPGEILLVSDVERIVFLTNDLVGVTSRFEIKAGSVPGTATVIVTPTADKRITGQVDLDNHGSRFSGEYRLGAGVTINSPLGLGDGLSLNVLATPNNGMNFGLVNYSLPIGSDGLKIGASYSRLHYELDPKELILDLRGDAETHNIFAIYPLVRSRNANIFMQGSLDERHYVDRQVVVGGRDEKDVRVGQIGLTGDFRDNIFSGSVNTFSTTFSTGYVSSTEPGYERLDQNRIKKLVLGYSRLQNVIENRALLLLRYTGQIAFSNLDSTERFSLGGPNGIRAYAPGEATGDQGHIVTAEMRMLPPGDWSPYAREFVGSIFYDAGWLKLQHKKNDASIGQDQRRFIHGIGLGLVWERPRDIALRSSIAWRLSDRGLADSADRVPRFYMSVTKKFD